MRWTVLGALAVLLPATVLTVLQYRSLLELESKTRTAVQADLRQTAHALATRVEAAIQNTSTEALAPVQASDLRREKLEAIGRQFQAIQQAHSEIDEVFAFSLCNCGPEPFAVFSNPDGAGWIKCTRFDEARVRRALDAFLAARPASRGGELLFSQAASSTLYVFRILSGNAANRQQSVFAGILLKPEWLAGQLLPHAASEVAGAESVAMRVAEEGSRAIWSNRAGPARLEMSMPFGAMFPLWDVEAGYQSTSIESLAREQFRRNLLLTGLVVLGLVAGIFLMVRATAREARLAELKSTFVSNVSHEMKTPLALIRMFAETLESGRVRDPAKIEEYHRVIHKESRRLTELIDNILDFARMEAGRKRYELARGDAGAVVHNLIDNYRDRIVSAGFELNVEIGAHLPAVSMDASAVGQAVLNLLNNAVAYSAEVKRIAVRVFEQGPWIAIEVADCGIGIPKSEHQRIFDKFYRVNTGLVHNTKGSGLGLAIVRHIVDAHGGRILVDSAAGRGSRFTILLPAQEPQQACVATGEPVAEGADRRG